MNYTTIMPSGGTLNPGDSVVSDNQSVKLTLQSDGDLVLLENGNQVIWDTGTYITPAQQPPVCNMQPDGNLVLYDKNGTPYWASQTAGHPNSILVVENEGNAVIFQPIWSALPIEVTLKKKKGAGILLTR